MNLLVVCLVFMAVFQVSLVILPENAAATTLFVGGGGPGNFTAIQDAINAAVAGDIVFVYNGTYNESVAITKTISLMGEDRDSTVIDGGGVGDVIYIFAHWVNVSGFTVRNSGTGMSAMDAGIDVHSVRNCSITNNIVTNNKNYGIHVDSSADTLVTDNIVTSNWAPGIHLWLGRRTSVLNNSVYSNIGLGIRIYDSNSNTIANNNITSNGGWGIMLDNPTSGNLIYHNSIVGNNLEAYDWGASAFDNGYPSGGNYWGDYSGVDAMCGPSQDIPGSDGIGDTAYTWIAAGTARDRYPLMSPTFPPPSYPSSAPVNANADRGDQQINLTWEAPFFDGRSPITNYRVYRGTSSGSETFLLELGNVLNHTDLGLTNGQMYYYEITAVNSLGESVRSNEVSAVPATNPGPPTGLNAARGDSEVVLNWVPPADDGGSSVTNYAIFRGIASGSESLLVTVGSTPDHTDTGLTNGVTYFYLVAAVNGVGQGLNSTEVNATPATFPSAPLNLLTTEGDQEVDLSWDHPADSGGIPVVNYRVYRGLTPGSMTFLVEIGNVTSYLDTGLNNGQIYYYEVGAVNGVGEGPASIETNATPATVPGAITDLAAEGSDEEVVLMWTMPVNNGGSPITNITVYGGSTPGGETILTVLGIIESYTDTGLINGVTYYYRVTALNRMGEGPVSNEVNALPATHPSEPLDLQLSVGNREVTLTWSIPESDGGQAVTNYRIYRGGSQTTVTFLLEIGNVLTYTDTNLTNGITHYYEVSALSGFGESARSIRTNATPTNQPPICILATPAPGSSVSGMIQVTGTSSDSDGNIQKVEIRIDDGLWIQVEGTSSWSYSWNTRQTYDGQHTIHFHSFDGEDYSIESSMSITVDNSVSNGGGIDLMWIALGTVLAIAVVAAGALVYVFRKRKGKRGKSAPNEQEEQK